MLQTLARLLFPEVAHRFSRPVRNQVLSLNLEPELGAAGPVLRIVGDGYLKDLYAFGDGVLDFLRDEVDTLAAIFFVGEG